ncbi:serine O-acetyltransferase EpsC [Desulfovibrio fairfieldensis]|uniref:serine O-acetyltransferase n=1 Tax=Desulfovibrio fairfieldensis TaxID=44742 RepID=A0A109W535_9BACT|nr:serine O-acetyltransferase EpsC [Desulfovibrio fairfieldensis]AMD91414.1 serine acetyltransferase [Desulfovibrio fairfieldensis]
MSTLHDDTTVSMPELDSVVERLCHSSSLDAVWHRPAQGAAMPSLDALKEIMERLRAAVFPGYFGSTRIRRESMRYHLAANLDSIYHKLSEQILRGFCFSCEGRHAATPCEACESEGTAAALKFMDRLPEIRRLLAGDAQAAYEGDPAATSPGETIFCYPSMHAMFHHRIAHELYTLKVPVIPRIISEMAHSRTGIDIHPGATIGEDFFIDHGTGVVIGETCILGRNCRLYQGVTLGALSFPKNPDGTLTKGIPRHPVLEDNVTVYAGATILGRVTIGAGAVIGGNVWITSDVPAGARISQEKPYA